MVGLDVNKEKYDGNYVLDFSSEIMLCNIDFIIKNFKLVEYEQKDFKNNKKEIIYNNFNIDITTIFEIDKHKFYNVELNDVNKSITLVNYINTIANCFEEEEINKGGKINTNMYKYSKYKYKYLNIKYKK